MTQSEFLKLQADFTIRLNSIVLSYLEHGNASESHLDTCHDMLVWLYETKNDQSFILWILGVYIGLMTLDVSKKEAIEAVYASNMQQLYILTKLDDGQA